jgi:hypothetical protein
VKKTLDKQMQELHYKKKNKRRTKKRILIFMPTYLRTKTKRGRKKNTGKLEKNFKKPQKKKIN